MTARFNAERAELRLRELCCMGLPAQQLAPLIYRELHTVIPHKNCFHMWYRGEAAAGVEVTDIYTYSDEFARQMNLYVDRFFHGMESEIWPTVKEGIDSEFGPRHLYQILRLSKTAFHKHPIYNEIARPVDQDTFLRVLIRDGKRPAASLMIGRGRADKDFSEEHLRVLRRLEPFIAMALGARTTASADADACDEDEALILADRTGRVQWLSDAARRLLSLSYGGMRCAPALSPGLLHTVRMLNGITAGDQRARVPLWRHSNAWGEFHARAYWMTPQAPGDSLVGIHLQRRTSRKLRVFGNISCLGLPLKQEQVCRLLAQDRSEDEIAGALAIKRSTVVYHRRQIYSRLEVGSRAQFIERLSHKPLQRAAHGL